MPPRRRAGAAAAELHGVLMLMLHSFATNGTMAWKRTLCRCLGAGIGERLGVSDSGGTVTVT